MTTTVTQNDPQAMFHKASDAPVPEWIERELTKLLGHDDLGDPVLRVRFDAERFKEGCWVVEEKWGPQVFGDPAEWAKTQVLRDDDGTIVDFGAFPSRGIYASIMLWVDHDGRPLPLGNELLERLKFQIYQRAAKSITPEQVAAETALKEAETEQLQNERFLAAQNQIAEDMKMDANKILKARSRVTSLPIGKIITLN